MSTVSGKTFFGGTVPPPAAPAPAVPQVNSNNIWQSIVGAGKNITDSVGQDLYNRSNKVADIQARTDTSAPEKALQTFGQGAGAAANALEVTAEQVPGVKQAAGAIGSGINWLATSELSPIKHLGDLIGQDHALQEVVHLYDTDKNFRDTIDGVANTARLGGDVATAVDGVNYAKNVTNKIVSNVQARTPATPITPTPKPVTVKPSIGSSIAQDVVPTSERLVNSEVTRALDLTQGDVKNISQSTGHEVGQFLADNNLIGTDIKETTTNLSKFFKTNYSAVRDEIGKVTDQYKANQIPHFYDALKQIQKEVDGIPGQEKTAVEIDNLLARTKTGLPKDANTSYSLADVQRAKELLDEHFQLYKATGDVKESVVKQGIANMRATLQKFIEDKVKATTGADIHQLNNNVSTARSISDAIDLRSTRGLTRANITPADIVTFFAGSSVGGPFVGAGAVLVKKIYNSPTFKLRLAKWLDGLNDAQKASLKADLQAGKIPENLNKEIQSPNAESSPSNKNESTPQTARTTNDIPATVAETGQKSSLLDKARQTASFVKDNIGDQRGFIKIADTPKTTTPEAFAQRINGSDVPLIQDFVANPTMANYMKLQAILDQTGLDALTSDQLQRFFNEVFAARNAPEFASQSRRANGEYDNK